MIVGLVSTWCARGAGYVFQQYQQALQASHDVFIYARGNGQPPLEESEWHGANVWWGSEPVADAGPSSIDLADFANWIETNRLDWVIFNEQWWMEPLLVCHRLGVKTAAYVVEYKSGQIPLYSAYDLLICHTRQHFDTFRHEHPGTHFIPWGTDLDYFRPNNLDPVEPGLLTFVHAVGSNAPRKGTDLVLLAFDRVRREFAHVRLALFSQYPVRSIVHPELFTHLEDAQVLRYRGPDAVTAEARQPVRSRIELYRSGDVYVYPCRFDGLGLSIPEAAAAGLPAVATDHPPMCEFVGDGNGVRVAVERTYHTPRAHHSFGDANIDSLMDALRHYAAGFGASHKQMARAYAEQNFDWPKNASGMAQLLEAPTPWQSPEALDRAMAQIREYEREQRRTITSKIRYQFPGLVKVARSAGRKLLKRV